jgi:hypothetical protein
LNFGPFGRLTRDAASDLIAVDYTIASDSDSFLLGHTQTTAPTATMELGKWIKRIIQRAGWACSLLSLGKRCGAVRSSSLFAIFFLLFLVIMITTEGNCLIKRKPPLVHRPRRPLKSAR